MILNELHLLMQILSNCFFHQWTVSHQGVLISCNMQKDGTEIQSDKWDLFAEIQEGGRKAFMILRELLQVEKRKISAASTSFTFCGHTSEKCSTTGLPKLERPANNFIYQDCNSVVFCSNKSAYGSIKISNGLHGPSKH